MNWPPTKAQRQRLLQQTLRDIPKPPTKYRSRRGRIYAKAKELGYSQNYKSASYTDMNKYFDDEGYDKSLQIVIRDHGPHDVTHLTHNLVKFREFLSKIPRTLRYAITFGDNLLPLNDAFWNVNDDEGKMITKLESEIHGAEKKDDSCSDVEFALTWIHKNSKETVTLVRMSQDHPFNRGDFFPYNISPAAKEKPEYEEFLKTYHRYVNPDNSDNLDCLGYSIKLAFPNLLQPYLGFRSEFPGTALQTNRLGKLADLLGLHIILYRHSLEKNIKTAITKFGQEEGRPTLKLSILAKHYFLFEDTCITNSILNSLAGLRIIKRPEPCLSSYSFIRQIIEKKIVTPFTADDWLNVNVTFKHDQPEIDSTFVEIYKGFGTGEKHDEPQEPRVVTTIYHPIYFDTETYRGEGWRSILYQLALTFKNRNVGWTELCFDMTNRCYTPYEILTAAFECLYKLAAMLPKGHKVMCIAHNLSYDIQTIMSYDNPAFRIVNRLAKTKSKTMTMSCVYKGQYITFLDSYGFLANPLDDFTRMFNVETQKGPFPYNAMNEKVVEANLLKIKTALKHIDPPKHRLFLHLIEPYITEDGKSFRVVDYSRKYCMSDVKLLREGFEVFREGVRKDFDMDVLQYVTTPSMARAIMLKNPEFRRIGTVKGLLRIYIAETCVGGRTMLYDNEPQDCRNVKVKDVDVTALYPFSFTRMGRVPITPPTQVTTVDNEKEYTTVEELYKDIGIPMGTWLYMDVDIVKIDKPRHIALLSRKDKETGNRIWKDEVGKYRINCVTLEDLCKFQKITYKFKGGFYMAKGAHDVSFKEFFEDLQSKRDAYKKAKNPVQTTYKLTGNCQHGKMEQKPIDRTEIYIDCPPGDNTKFMKYMSKHFYEIIRGYPLPNLTKGGNVRYVIVKTKMVANHANQCHVASIMYAHSKRVMNEVIYLAEDNGLKVMYTDTDSLFISAEDLEVLKPLYEKEYGKPLLGNGFGRFHSDFDIEEAPGTEGSAYASGVFFGKKSYFLRCYYTAAATEEKEATEFEAGVAAKPVRPATLDIEKMKSIPKTAIKEYYRSQRLTHEELRDQLAEGEEIPFDLTTNQVRFEVDDNFRYSMRRKWIRKVSFPPVNAAPTEPQ